MKTVEDAVKQENGVWRKANKCNAMAWLFGKIDYVWINDKDNLFDEKYGNILISAWQLVCTREQFEAEAKRLGYRKELNPPTYTSGKDDPVNHPTHYTSGEIECIDAIRAALTPEEFRGFCKGNVIKYVWRSNLKGDRIKDQKKALWYLNRLVDNERDMEKP